MRISVGKFLLVMAAFSLAACGGFPATHPDAVKNNPANHQVDMKDCTQSYPETPDGVYLKQRINCMKLKGWQ
jgi:predicted small lipoprotein YifL